MLPLVVAGATAAETVFCAFFVLTLNSGSSEAATDDVLPVVEDLASSARFA